jgi:GMP synthase-like glutamine amidotransferase
MILIINICKEKLHYLEFVKPIEDILILNKCEFHTKHYKEILESDLKNCDNIIICGTSLYDNHFINDLNYFNWINEFKKPVLGICGGMQIVGLIFGGKVKRKTEIGFYKESFAKEFFGVNGECEVYHLHNNYIQTSTDFEVYSSSNDGKISQAIKHKTKEIYGVLFHPEVRNKEIIKNFIFKGSLEKFY